jgi:ATP phosphoribosyltransferase regulatory subunit HisZ
MREIFGFAAGVTAAAMAAVFLRSEEGQKLLRRLQEQAQPEIEAASDDWEPFLREAARAVKLGSAELSGAVDKLAAYLGTLAEEAPEKADTANTADKADDVTQQPAPNVDAHSAGQKANSSDPEA